MGGLLSASDGAVRCEGEVPDDCLNPMTYVFQDFALLPWRSVAGNVALVLEGRMPRAACADRVREVLALTGLADFADALPKAALGRHAPACRHRTRPGRPPGLPAAGRAAVRLDAQTRDLLLEEFAALIARAGTTTVYVTHNLQEAVRLGQQIVVLSRRPGRVRDVLRLDRPLAGRTATDPDLAAMEQHLWRMIRDDAVEAERERADAPA